MVSWILLQTAKGCHYKTTFMMTKEQWHRSTKEKTLSKPLRGKRFQIKCSMKWIWKIQLCRISSQAKDILRKKGALVTVSQSMTFIANTSWQRLNSSDLASACWLRDNMLLANKWKFKLNLRSFPPPPHLECIGCVLFVHSDSLLSDSLYYHWNCCTN